jgi:DNA-binding MarR family transcriptional regulator
VEKVRERRTRRTRKVTAEEYRALAEFRFRLRQLFHACEQRCTAHGITSQQYALMLAIKGHETCPRQLTVTEAAQRLQMSPQAASLLIDRAERRGLTSKRLDGVDRRYVLLELTPLGKSILQQITVDNRNEVSEYAHQLLDPGLLRQLSTDAGEPDQAASNPILLHAITVLRP